MSTGTVEKAQEFGTVLPLRPDAQSGKGDELAVHGRPLVSVVTPVYNGDKYLEECIDSVLAQTYTNFEYIILNNASKDRTLEIAERYAQKDPRIKVYSNDKLLDVISNHNHAFSLISPASKYCKVVSADDWILPECLTRMVDLAEANPSVGIVGAYQLSGGGKTWFVRNFGLPFQGQVTPGTDICHAQLLGEISVLGNPTSVLYRADLVRNAEKFYPNLSAEADLSACFVALRNADLGFVHQVLSYEREHEIRQTTNSQSLNAYLPSNISDLLEYGKYYLSDAEIRARLDELLSDYYNFLGESALKLRDKKFWDYHRRRLNELGYPLSTSRLSLAVGAKLADLIFNPKRTLEKVIARLRPSAKA